MRSFMICAYVILYLAAGGWLILSGYGAGALGDIYAIASLAVPYFFFIISLYDAF